MASYGGGTSLATQRECLELMDCHGKGKAYKLLEIAAGVVMAGELSLVSATRTDKETGANEWVDAHEKLGRNRYHLTCGRSGTIFAAPNSAGF